MPTLRGGVAYRGDQLLQFGDEIAAWDAEQEYQYPIACPKEAACDKFYHLLLEADSSPETAQEYVGMILRAMKYEPCDKHPPRIRINAT